MANLRILTPERGRQICSDSFALKCSFEAMQAGRAAFWTAHLYHDQPCANAADKANRYGLDVGCQSIVDWAKSRHDDPAPHITRFLSKLWPANEAARVALIRAEADFLCTFSEQAA